MNYITVTYNAILLSLSSLFSSLVIRENNNKVLTPFWSLIFGIIGLIGRRRKISLRILVYKFQKLIFYSIISSLRKAIRLVKMFFLVVERNKKLQT